MCDEGLTLGDLIGTLKEFFSRLGLTKLRFKPAYNPYTEPSMEIFRFGSGVVACCVCLGVCVCVGRWGGGGDAAAGCAARAARAAQTHSTHTHTHTHTTNKPKTKHPS